ncbi:unnamed protein product [Boreogadus saida]
MSRKKLAWANKEVETFVCILGEEDVVYDVYVAAAAIDIRPTTKGTVGSGNATSELSWANRSLPTAPLRSDPFRTLQWKCGSSKALSSAQRASLSSKSGPALQGRVLGFMAPLCFTSQDFTYVLD